MTSEHTRRTARGSAPDVSRWSKRLGAIDGERTFSLRERLHPGHLQRVRIDEHRNTTSASQLPTKTVKNAETDKCIATKLLLQKKLMSNKNVANMAHSEMRNAHCSSQKLHLQVLGVFCFFCEEQCAFRIS